MVKLKSVQDLAEYENYEQEWVLRGILPVGKLIFLAGPAKLGRKSLFLLAASRRICRGEPFMGLDTIKTSVIYSDLENGETELGRRVFSLGFNVEERWPIRFSTEAEHVEAIYNLVSVKQKRVLWIIDGWSEMSTQVAGLKSENDAPEVTKILKPYRQLCHATNSTIVLIHHMNKGGGMRGSVALEASNDGYCLVEPWKDDVERKTMYPRLRCDSPPEQQGDSISYEFTKDPEGHTVVEALDGDLDGDDYQDADSSPRKANGALKGEALEAALSEALQRSGDVGMSTRKLAQETGANLNHVRSVTDRWATEGFIVREGKSVRGHKNWVIATR